MRVVIDGTPLHDDDNLRHVTSRLLQVWGQPHGVDELHLVVAAAPRFPIPDWVTVHEVPAARRGRLGRLWARSLRVPYLCHSLKAQVLLALRPTFATRVLRPRHTVVYDLWHQPGSEQFAGADLAPAAASIAWSGFARRLRMSMVDAVADADWHARRFKINPALLWSRPSPSGAGVRLFVPHRRSVRLIAAVSASTLALSAAAAASVDLVASHNFPIDTPHHITTTSATAPSSVGGGGTRPSSTPLGAVPLPPSSTSTTAAGTSTATSSPGASPTTAPKAGPSAGAATQLTIPTLTLPSITLPTITVPTLPLPLPTLTCSTSTTQSSSPLSILNLCNLHLGGH